MYSPSDIIVKFTGHPELRIILDNNLTAKSWLELFKKNYQREFPIFRDQKKYTLDYLNQLALRCNKDLGWDCETNIRSINDTIKLHKNLETTLAKGFSSIPEIYDNLIHELHFCLHKAEFVDFAHNIRQLLQIEWFNDEGFLLDESFQHTLDIKFGDVRLQNPYVGHAPIHVYVQDDYSEIIQTCRFHDFVRPGMYIHAIQQKYEFDINDYIDWWNIKAPEFVKLHGMEKILHYTGHPVIGRVLNLDDLETIVNDENILELEYVFTK